MIRKDAYNSPQVDGAAINRAHFFDQHDGNEDEE
jgi:hypothetical protein